MDRYVTHRYLNKYKISLYSKYTLQEPTQLRGILDTYCTVEQTSSS